MDRLSIPCSSRLIVFVASAVYFNLYPSLFITIHHITLAVFHSANWRNLLSLTLAISENKENRIQLQLRYFFY